MLGVIEMNLILAIQEAFSTRQRPKLLLISKQLAPHEYEDMSKWLAEDSSSITCDQLEKHFEAINWLTPEAFCYYLPAILCASIREEKPGIIVTYSLIGMLDRGPEISSWDNFFLARWPLLSVRECEALQEWTLWLSSFPDSGFSESSLSRAFDTLEVLKLRAK